MSFSLILIDFATESNLLTIRAFVFVVVVFFRIRHDRVLTYIVWRTIEAVIVKTHTIAVRLAIEWADLVSIRIEGHRYLLDLSVRLKFDSIQKQTIVDAGTYAKLPGAKLNGTSLS